MSTLINTFTIGIFIVALFANLLFSKYEVLQRINASIYIISIGTYIYLSRIILEYLKEHFIAEYSFIDIFSSLLTLISAAAGVMIIIGSFYHNELFHKMAFRIFEIVLIIVCAVLIFNLFSSNKQALFLLPMVILTFVLSFSAMLNSTENLKTLSSKIYYFTSDIILAAFWITCIILFTQKSNSIINNQFYILISIIGVLCFASPVFGLIRLFKGKVK